MSDIETTAKSIKVNVVCALGIKMKNLPLYEVLRAPDAFKMETLEIVKCPTP